MAKSAVKFNMKGKRKTLIITALFALLLAGCSEIKYDYYIEDVKEIKGLKVDDTITLKTNLGLPFWNYEENTAYSIKQNDNILEIKVVEEYFDDYYITATNYGESKVYTVNLIQDRIYAEIIVVNRDYIDLGGKTYV